MAAPYDLERALSTWRQSRSQEIALTPDQWAELEAHLRDAFDRHAAQGVPPELAFTQATQALGDLPQLIQEYKKNTTPVHAWLAWAWFGAVALCLILILIGKPLEQGDGDMPAGLHLLAALPLLLFSLVTVILAKSRRPYATLVAAALAFLCLALQPLPQLALDGLIGRPSALKKKALAEKTGILGKDAAFVIRLLGEPTYLIARPGGQIISREGKITSRGDPYTSLYYSPSRFLYLSTRFIVFLNQDGLVYHYRVKWERQPSDSVLNEVPPPGLRRPGWLEVDEPAAPRS
jgi:hypothetical protein